MQYAILFVRDEAVAKRFEGSVGQKVYDATMLGLDEAIGSDHEPLYALFLESNPLIYLKNRLMCRGRASIFRVNR